MIRTRKLYKLVLELRHLVKTFNDLKYHNFSLCLRYKAGLIKDYNALVRDIAIVDNMHFRLRLDQ